MLSLTLAVSTDLQPEDAKRTTDSDEPCFVTVSVSTLSTEIAESLQSSNRSRTASLSPAHGNEFSAGSAISRSLRGVALRDRACGGGEPRAREPVEDSTGKPRILPTRACGGAEPRARKTPRDATSLHGGTTSCGGALPRARDSSSCDLSPASRRPRPSNTNAFHTSSSSWSIRLLPPPPFKCPSKVMMRVSRPRGCEEKPSLHPFLKAVGCLPPLLLRRDRSKALAASLLCQAHHLR